MRGPPVVLTNTLGRPVTNIISERGAVPMTVVNTLGEPVTLVAQGGEPVTLFNPNGTLWDYPFSLFANNEQGAWYDPSDFSTLYQNSTGTTPVTAVEQPVGLMLDRSRGLVLGAELVGASVVNTAVPTKVTYDGAGRITITGVLAGETANVSLADPNAVSGKTYKWNVIVHSIAGDSFTLLRPSSGNFGQISAPGTYEFVDTSTSTSDLVRIIEWAGILTDLDVTISVRELPGNHATQATSASRPVLRARYNLLTRSEEYDDGAWSKTNATVTANAAVAPDGTTTADLIVPTAVSGAHFLSNVSAAGSSGAHAFSLFCKASGYSRIGLREQTSTGIEAVFVLSGAGSVLTTSGAATATITALENGWYRISMALTLSGAANFRTYPLDDAYTSGNLNSYSWTGDGTSGIYLRGAQLLSAADEAATGGAYQRIAAATDYDVSNPVWRPYLAFDGTDDSFSTSSIDFSATDEMTVFAGVTKLSDAALALFVELSASSTGNNGAFGLFAPNPGNLYTWRSKGTTSQDVNTSASAYSAPDTSVLTGIGDISDDVSTLRIDGVQVGTNTNDQGTGNFGNYPLFIGRRNNTNLPFNGRLYSLAVLGRTATAAELASMEAWVAGKTGVTI